MAVPKEKDFMPLLASCRILVVGAGGIGCELLKNLVLTGFEDIEVIDLDTIDVSNLNRQFLFQKCHVGRSKAEVAKESALRFNPKAKIVAHHDSVLKPKYGVPFFKEFTMVMNALDNQAARNHVNRLCLASDVPLVESGTAGYLGQVTVIKKGLTECYECQPKAAQKTYPGCTIRNTPSEPIHCIVWAKHLFNQLFGEADPDEDVSPDSADPELVGQAGKSALDSSEAQSKASTTQDNESASNGNVLRVSTRAWASSHDYCPKRSPFLETSMFTTSFGFRLPSLTILKLFTKLFSEDILYLLSMEKLWENRRRPTPLTWEEAGTIDEEKEAENDKGGIADQRLWSVKECQEIFSSAVHIIRKRLTGEVTELVWDKDDESSMDFVCACANLRAHIFGIQRKTRFDVKSMAGNIIPAIATTNAVIAGLIVLEGLKVLAGEFGAARTTYLNRRPNPRRRLLVPCALDPPRPQCLVCAPRPRLALKLPVALTSVGALKDKVLRGALAMAAPDVEVVDGKGTILISSEEGETQENNGKMLKEFNIVDGTQLNCDDFLQNYNILVDIIDCDQLKDGAEFEVIGDPEQLKKEQEEQAKEQDKKEEEQTSSSSTSAATAAASLLPPTAVVEDDDDLVCLDDVIVKKRKVEEGEEREEEPPLKKARSGGKTEEEEEIMVLE
ncbi:SUMO-activating enzyme subunit 2-like isoform X4 [Scylla paramamosain]|uniref:SUMO-activating enzyme subunit 2-like isoform X4 n=1 Tax=Scylla paramamosain TaxID=85552 RepID=UPI003083D906